MFRATLATRTATGKTMHELTIVLFLVWLLTAVGMVGWGIATGVTGAVVGNAVSAVMCAVIGFVALRRWRDH